MRFAKRLGLRYHPGRDALSARYGDLSMMVTIRERALNAGTATCNTCVTMPNLGLGIWIRPEHALDRLWDRVGGSEIRLGDPRIDAALRIQSDYPEWVRRHMNTVDLRASLTDLLDRKARIFVADNRVRTRVEARIGTRLEQVILQTLAVAEALQRRGETALQSLEVPGLYTSAAVAAGTVDGTPLSIREVQRASGSCFEIRATMPWSTPGLRVTHADEGAARLGDLILDMLVCVEAYDMERVRSRFCEDAVRAPLASVCHGRPGSVWTGEQLVTYAENDVADLAAAVEDVLELAAALGGPPEHDDDARSGAGGLGNTVLEGPLRGAAEDDQVAPPDAKALAGSAAEGSNQEAARLADGDQGDQ